MADEILFQARIHPETPTSALSADEVESIRKAMLDVCNLAVSVDADDARCAWERPRAPKSLLRHCQSLSSVLSISHCSAVCGVFPRFPKDWLYHTRWHKVGGKVLGHPVRRAPQQASNRTAGALPALL